MGKLFFVYGSLKFGYWNNDLLADSKRLGEFITKDKFLLTDVGFPYLVPESVHTDAVGHPTLRVVGEVYTVSSKAVEASLDALEGVSSNHYERQQIEVESMAGDTLTVFAYIPCDREYAAKQDTCTIMKTDNEKFYIW